MKEKQYDRAGQLGKDTEAWDERGKAGKRLLMYTAVRRFGFHLKSSWLLSFRPKERIKVSKCGADERQ